MKKFLCMLISLVSLGCTAAGSYAEEFQVLGSDFPPLMYEKDGKTAGFYSELLQMMLEDMPSAKITTQFYPAPRLLMMVEENPNTFALGIARIPSREQKYKWVGPSIQTNSALYKLKTRSDLQIRTITDLRPYRIGTGRGYAIRDVLLNAGVPAENIQEVTVDTQNIKKLFAGRFDFMAAVDAVFWHLLRQEGHNYHEVESVKIDTVSVKYDMYYAFNKSTADQVILQFQQRLDRVKQTERYKELVKRYIPE